MYNSMQDGFGGGIKIGLAVLVLIVVACVGLSYFGGRQSPKTHVVEKVIPDANLPH